MKPEAQWDVVRTGSVIRIDLTRATNFTDADTDAIVAATEELIQHDEVQVIRLDGPVLLHGQPPDGLRSAVGSLEAFARRHGTRFVVGSL